jgi:hypothetical protein
VIYLPDLTLLFNPPATEQASTILEQYPPPYDVLSDMLLVPALCPTRPLQGSFPGQPFLSIAGRTPLLLWYSRVREIQYGHAGERQPLGGENRRLYNEVTVLALLRERELFVPAIYATSDLTIEIGHAYGMPKQKSEMLLQVERDRISSLLQEGGRESRMSARLLGPAGFMGRLLSWLWPRWVWPTRFPDGRDVRALIQAAPCVQPAWVRGRLSLDTPWLPKPISLLPLGLYLADQCMTLPPP